MRFVLAPGASLGTWAWRQVSRSVEHEGHSASPVTLAGMGERVHLATKDAGMETAIQDVLNTVRYEEIEECVVVGHSFVGTVAAAIADRAHDRVRIVLHVDAFRPERIREPKGGFDPNREPGRRDRREEVGEARGSSPDHRSRPLADSHGASRAGARSLIALSA